jgi:hypothetical protein
MTAKLQMLKNVRLACSECLGGPRAIQGKWPISNASDVDGCTAQCIWHPFRRGIDPKPAKRSKPPSEAQMRVRRNFGRRNPRIDDLQFA